MKDAIHLFTALGKALGDFGATPQTEALIVQACEENPWFTPSDIRRAVGAFIDQMLQPKALERWLKAYQVPVATPRNVLVIMAGNIPLVGFFDLLCVVASGHRCLVKPSSKDAVLMGYLIDLLHIIEPSVALERYHDQPIDAVIATGGESANRAFRSRYATIPALLRGSRQSVAVLTGKESPSELAALADDIWAYSGLGCRSISLLFLPRGYTLRLQMPPMNPKYINNYRQTKALLTLNQTPHLDFGASVAVEQRAFPSALSLLSYTYYDSVEEVVAWLLEHDEQLQCVVSSLPLHTRQVPFGRGQAPTLTEYPDECDVLEFLTSF